jgi:pyridoxamine 5'-phosphate oxidase-like protein
MIDPRIQRCLGAATSVLVATVDAQGTPSCCHAAAIRPDDDLKTVAIYLPIATSQQIIQDIATTHRVAVAATQVVEHFSIQLKGLAQTARLARDDESAFVEEHHQAFVDVLHSIGIPRRLTRSLTHWPAFVVDMVVEEVFEQTPGPNAGARLR